MTALVEKLDRALYPTYARNWDDQLFRERILQHLTPTTVILDLGAGAGIVQQMNFRGHAARVCGVDLDPRVVDNVLEHLPDPLAVFREVARVLKRGGVFLFKTPNKTHYMPTIARLTPHRFHQFVNRISFKF